MPVRIQAVKIEAAELRGAKLRNAFELDPVQHAHSQLPYQGAIVGLDDRWVQPFGLEAGPAFHIRLIAHKLLPHATAHVFAILSAFPRTWTVEVLKLFVPT